MQRTKQKRVHGVERADRRAGSRAGPSPADEAHKRIEELIVLLRLAPGSYVSEETLGDRLGIGRAAIREALQRLAVARLIVILRRRRQPTPFELKRTA